MCQKKKEKPHEYYRGSKKSLARKQGDYKSRWFRRCLAFLPTNSDCFGIVLMPTEPILDQKDGISTEVWQAPGRFWNPRAADLLREDWELV